MRFRVLIQLRRVNLNLVKTIIIIKLVNIIILFFVNKIIII